jgi:hypothetical protein
MLAVFAAHLMVLVNCKGNVESSSKMAVVILEYSNLVECLATRVW